MLFAEDQEQVIKLLILIPPNLEKIVYFETKGMYSYDHPKLMPFSEFLEIGKSEYESFKDFVEQEVLKLDDDDIAMMIYTSGTRTSKGFNDFSRKYEMGGYSNT